MKKIAAALALCTLFGGCASSGVVPVGDGVMMLTKKGAGGVFTNGNEVLADLYREANDYCTQQHLQLHQVSTETENAVPFVHLPYAELRFRCAAASASAQ